MAWWLFPDEHHNADGGHREYLERPAEWRHFDPSLFDTLVAISKVRNRDVRAIEETALLPNAVFARDPVPCDVRPTAQRPAVRQRWISDIKASFKNCDLIFLDPDNGLAPEGLRPTWRHAGKSVFIEDLQGLAKAGRAMIVYHHQTRRRGGHEVELSHVASELRSGGFQASGVLRAKPWSPRAFFILDGDEALCKRAEEIASVWEGWISWHPNP